jgi:DNA-directed RNA polymerase specialized sigma24 family protein
MDALTLLPPQSAEDDFAAHLADRMAVEWLLTKLTPEERDILLLHAVERVPLEEIGQIIGERYYDGARVKVSTIRYRKDQIKRRLRDFAPELGLEVRRPAGNRGT